MIGAALLSERVADVRLRLADARQLLRDVEGPSQRQDRVCALLVVRVVGEGSLRIVGAAGVVPGGGADDREVRVELGPLEVERSHPGFDLLRGGTRLVAL